MFTAVADYIAVVDCIVGSALGWFSLRTKFESLPDTKIRMRKDGKGPDRCCKTPNKIDTAPG